MRSSLPAGHHGTIWSRWTWASWPHVTFGHCSHGPAFPPDYHENHQTWVDSILIVPQDFMQFFLWVPLLSFISEQSLLISYCTLSIFCWLNDCIFCDIVSLIPLLSEHYHCCISDPGNVLRYFDPINNNYEASLLNKHHTTQDLCLFLSRESQRPIPTIVRSGIYGTNFSVGLGGRDMYICLDTLGNAPTSSPRLLLAGSFLLRDFSPHAVNYASLKTLMKGTSRDTSGGGG